jgi:hypothetical protein
VRARRPLDVRRRAVLSIAERAVHGAFHRFELRVSQPISRAHGRRRAPRSANHTESTESPPRSSGAIESHRSRHRDASTKTCM